MTFRDDIIFSNERAHTKSVHLQTKDCFDLRYYEERSVLILFPNLEGILILWCSFFSFVH
jgi:hypothetical protein